MTPENRESNTYDRDDVFLAQDIDFEENDILLADNDDEDDLPKPVPRVASERIVDDKVNTTREATQI